MNPTPSVSPEGNSDAELQGRSLSAALTVRDVQASLTWYCDVLGFKLERKFEREGRLQAASLSAGVARILLGQDDGAKGEGRAKGVGFSLQVTTTQNIDELANRIKARGGVLESAPFDAWGARAVRLLDPDGFRLTISSERPATPGT